jgi:hypothetical protein
MSQEALRIVDEQIRSYRAGDVEAAASLFDRCAVVDASRLGTDEPAVGVHEINRLVGGFKGVFDAYDYETTELIDAGGNTVVALVHEQGRGKSSGVPVDRHVGVVYNVVGDKITRITSFPSREAALEAVGLTE